MKICARFVLFLGLLAVAGCAFTEKTRKQASYHYQMGVSFFKEQNFTGALNELTEAEKLNPDDADVLYYLGMTYLYKNQFAAAERRFKRALELRSNFSDARNNLGVTYLAMKRWDDAIREFTIVSQDLFFSDQESAGINLGLAYLGKGDTVEAVALLRKSVVTSPQNPMAHLSLGRVYFADGKVSLAIGEYEEAIRLMPTNYQAQYHLGIAYLKIQKIAEARKAFQETVRLAPYTEFGQLAKEQLDALK